MAESLTTQPSLLLRLREPRDLDSWAEFVELYAPLVYGFLRNHGVQGADAAELFQDVLVRVATAVGTFDYDPQRGSFRGWLLTIVRNRLRNFRRDRARHIEAAGGTAAGEMLRRQVDETETGSFEGQVRFAGGDLAHRLLQREQLTADDFRLRPDSAGFQTGPEDRDQGANIDLVGPGVAYERWKRTAEYQEWRKEANQVLTMRQSNVPVEHAAPE